jgi:hypothetical protein
MMEIDTYNNNFDTYDVKSNYANVTINFLDYYYNKKNVYNQNLYYNNPTISLSITSNNIKTIHEYSNFNLFYNKMVEIGAVWKSPVVEHFTSQPFGKRRIHILVSGYINNGNHNIKYNEYIDLYYDPQKKSFYITSKMLHYY